MILYHTSNKIIEKPDVSHSRNCLDFGRGFYLTVLREQAVEYGKRFQKVGEDAFLNIYEMEDDLQGFTRKAFAAYDEEWLDFVMDCRQGKPTQHFDWISGGIANDKIFNTIDLYIDGLISKQEALRRLIYEKPNQQICITNQDILTNYLVFKEAIQIPL